MTSLTELDLSGNQIVQGLELVGKLFRLKDQSDGLRVDNYAGQMLQLTRLEELVLRHNELTQFPSDFRKNQD